MLQLASFGGLAGYAERPSVHRGRHSVYLGRLSEYRSPFAVVFPLLAVYSERLPVDREGLAVDG